MDNFALTGNTLINTGAATLVSVTGSGATYIVTANSGLDGLLGLALTNATGLNAAPSNLPFNGPLEVIDNYPLTASIRVNRLKVSDANVGPAQFAVTVKYSEVMDTSSTPVLSFPVENPGGSLTFVSGSWLDTVNYRVDYDVADLNLTLSGIDIRVSGGTDTGGSVLGEYIKANVFDLDTQNPNTINITRVSPALTNLDTVQWSVNFSEPVTGLTAANLTLLNTGLGSNPAITSVSKIDGVWQITASTGTGEGTLGLNLTSLTGIKDLFGNVLTGSFLTGASIAIDHIAPSVTFTPSNTVVNDSLVGPNNFHITAKFSELMRTADTPVIVFPTEVPVGSITFTGGVWVDNQTYRADYTVADLGTTLLDIDVALFGGAADAAGNLATPFLVADLIDLDTQNALTSFVYSVSPVGTYYVGQSLEVALYFSEFAILNGQLTVTFDTGRTETFTASDLTFDGFTLLYTVAVGDMSANLKVTNISLTNGTFTDTAGNAFDLTVPMSNATSRSIDGNLRTVTGLVVNDGAVQRSRINTITVNINAPVPSSMLAGLTLTRTTGVPVLIDVSSGVVVTAFGSTATITFANLNNSGLDSGSLSDGRWQLNIPLLNYQSPLGDPTLRRIFGDADSNGTIDGSDLVAFGNSFNQASLAFDFNADGTVDGSDLVQFGNRFGITL